MKKKAAHAQMKHRAHQLHQVDISSSMRPPVLSLMLLFLLRSCCRRLALQDGRRLLQAGLRRAEAISEVAVLRFAVGINDAEPPELWVGEKGTDIKKGLGEILMPKLRIIASV